MRSPKIVALGAVLVAVLLAPAGAGSARWGTSDRGLEAQAVALGTCDVAGPTTTATLDPVLGVGATWYTATPVKITLTTSPTPVGCVVQSIWMNGGGGPVPRPRAMLLAGTNLAAAAAPGATNIKVASVAGMAPGGGLTVDNGGSEEAVTITAVGTAGAGGTGVTITPALAFAHASGALVSLVPAIPPDFCMNSYFEVTGPVYYSCEGVNRVKYYAIDSDANQGPTGETTIRIDTTDPETTPNLSPGIRNGWYASPTLTLVGSDPGGSGVDRVDYSRDGGPWTLYSGPLSGFSTGNHVVQYRSTDVAGNVETPGLIAFKVDAQKPSVNITKPAESATYVLDKPVASAFKCTDGQSGMDTCVGTVANGANVDTSTVGAHVFTVTGTDKAGNVTVVTHHYTVVYTWNGFFNPISNTADAALNLVHAGDLIKAGFGLNGDRGLSVFAGGFPASVPVACPAWAPHAVPAAGAGTTPGLSYGVASGHYTYGWQTSAGWAGTCREFQVKLNDGSATVHGATFMFFA